MNPSTEGEAGRWVYGFAEAGASMRNLLGNKGANLAEMTDVLGPDRIPGGFTITTTACVEFMRTGAVPPMLDEQIDAALAELERQAGKGFGAADDPLLVSVRSGAPVSMPGMLDTILNLGLNDTSTEGLAQVSGNPRFAWDSRRRLVQMFSEVVRGVPAADFERALSAARKRAGVELDGELDEVVLRDLVNEFLGFYSAHTGEAFPDDPREQLRQAVVAVFESWGNERAVVYRRLNGIPDDLGTGVTVQRMVFGNLGEDSGSGVAFSRDPSTGEPQADGDYLVNAQGEDVVAGVRNTEDLEGLRRRSPELHAELVESLARLERHFRDIQDIEYTIERGRLFILQTRGAKRHARAAIRFALDAVREGLLDRAGALKTIDPGTLDALLHPSFTSEAAYETLTRGVAASPGAARGEIALTAAEAESRAKDGDAVILVREFTSADDISGFHAARGILTSQGGKSSHAAIVARGMGRPCVCGASELEIDELAGVIKIGAVELRSGDTIAIDGATGVVTADEVELVPPSIDADLDQVLSWADESRRLGVRANADSAEDAARARELGCEGIGLCRTEHMFFGADREPVVREMFIAAELHHRSGSDEDHSRLETALERLEGMQRGDFEEILAAMRGLPVTIRLLDPPVHEFIGVDTFERELQHATALGNEQGIATAAEGLAIARDLEETNPMLGTRGVRLGLLLPGLYEMQVRAIARAALRLVADDPTPVEIEIMVPLVAFPAELEAISTRIEQVIEDEGVTGRDGVRFEIGTMVELPGACLQAGRIAEQAAFFSFGTNDLTQTALGFSRDDVERGFIPLYLDRGLLSISPFERIDTEGVGELVRIGAERGRSGNPDLRLGICGEHGGDPASIAFFESIGLDYVSCSPYRVPVARVAAARAALEAQSESG